MSSDVSSRPTNRPLRRWIVRLAPYVITVAVITFLLRQYPLSRIVAEVIHGDWANMVPFAVIGVVLSLLAVSAADTIVVRAVCGHARYRDLVRGKAASSLLDILGYAAGHGAYGVWFARFTGARPGLAGGSLLFIMASDLLSVCLVASISVWGFGLDNIGAGVRCGTGGRLT